MRTCGHLLINVESFRLPRAQTQGEIYLQVTLGRLSKRTPLQSKESLVFERSREETFNVECRFESDEISGSVGDTDVPIQPALWDRTHSDWYTLLDRGRPAGQLYIMMEFRPLEAWHHWTFPPSRFPQ